MKFKADEVTVTAGTAHLVDVECQAEASEVLKNFTMDDVISHFGLGEILDHIGEEEAKHHFGIQDIEE